MPHSEPTPHDVTSNPAPVTCPVCGAVLVESTPGAQHFACGAVKSIVAPEKWYTMCRQATATALRLRAENRTLTRQVTHLQARVEVAEHAITEALDAAELARQRWQDDREAVRFAHRQLDTWARETGRAVLSDHYSIDQRIYSALYRVNPAGKWEARRDPTPRFTVYDPTDPEIIPYSETEVRMWESLLDAAS